MGIKITTHIADALKRLVIQYAEKPNMVAALTAFVKQIQESEDTLFAQFEDRSLQTGIGVQLDNWGLILSQPRRGLDDETYRTRLFIRIAELNSQGTPQDMIAIFTALMRPASGFVLYSEIHPAGFCLTAVDPDPIGDLQDVAEGMETARPAGVEVSCLISAPDPPFGFAGTPGALGFGAGGLATSFGL